jgi:thioesterase domain-containing protein
VAKAHTVAQQRYRPGPFHGDLTLFRATERPEDEAGLDEALGWSGLVTGNIRIVPAPGRHEHLMVEPAVTVIAEEVRSVLRQTAVTVVQR